MNDWLIPTLTALIGGVLTYVATRNKVRFDFDSRLRDLRIASYGELWKRLKPLAKYPRPPFDAHAAADLSEQLRLWYFTDGGIYLTVAAREQCFVLQDALARIVEDRPWQGVWTSPERRELAPATWEHLRICGSRLRTGLTRDIGTRNRPRFRGDSERFDYARATGTYSTDAGKQQLRLSFDIRPLSQRRPRVDVLRGDREIAVLGWSPSRSAIRIRVTPHGESYERRVLVRIRVTRRGESYERRVLVEDGSLIEGPILDDPAAAPPPVLWTRDP